MSQRVSFDSECPSSPGSVASEVPTSTPPKTHHMSSAVLDGPGRDAQDKWELPRSGHSAAPLEHVRRSGAGGTGGVVGAGGVSSASGVVGVGGASAVGGANGAGDSGVSGGDVGTASATIPLAAASAVPEGGVTGVPAGSGFRARIGCTGGTAAQMEVRKLLSRISSTGSVIQAKLAGGQRVALKWVCTPKGGLCDAVTRCCELLAGGASNGCCNLLASCQSCQ
jgi:hypothetical protein